MTTTGDIAVYAKSGDGTYTNPAFAGAGELCDLECAMHLAVRRGDGPFVPMRNDTAVLFAAADEPTDERPRGVTKTLIDPWLVARPDGGWTVMAVRRNQHGADDRHAGDAMLFRSANLVDYEPDGYLHLSDTPIRNPRCVWNRRSGRYLIEWRDGRGVRQTESADLRSIGDVWTISDFTLQPIPDDAMGIDGAIAGNAIAVDEHVLDTVEGRLGVIRNTAVDQPTVRLRALHPGAHGVDADATGTPSLVVPHTVVCRYSDGSTHAKQVTWDAGDLARIDMTVPGSYEVRGRIIMRERPFPFIPDHLGDPCICRFRGRYYLTGSQLDGIVVRCADTIDGLAAAAPQRVVTVSAEGKDNVWAQEMHVIDGTAYVFTTLGPDGWSSVQAVVFRCDGDPMDPDAWGPARHVVRPDGSLLAHGGISLDMTYFEVGGVSYVMWSGRRFRDRTTGADGVYPANVYIATVDRSEPWRLTGEPVCVMRPLYGWDRCETEVDEGPYLLRHGDDLFVTVSGSSTGLADLYCVGLLHAKTDSDLLDPASWHELGYPILTKESVPGEYGPGHNSFVTDPDTGDDLLVYHAVPHDERNVAQGRHTGIRRVHWAASGYPYLEMTPERDCDPRLRDVTLTVIVE
ncbi:family 43 glycosylhydrolase [Bifidobacterium sp. 82T10]|uniref:Family 43 glycosylhydrolase n=1 Tax=Bifidobacterium miconis TaxID=2834435 RepID=A0ABS6WHD7_9BIFI|nr:family 43 glycosylhydrolase [Bifidobacterium miconis]MBW3093459.1 family 43 glycosylhydrolase [Bifidobacterium miconis]